MITFAENFQNDDSISILQRYPNSQRPSDTSIPKAWPLKQGPTTGAEGNTVLALPVPEFTSSLELAFTLANDGDNDNLSSAQLSLFGGIELVTNETGVAVRINGASTYPLQGESYRTDVGELQQWSVRYDESIQMLYVRVNGSIVLSQELPERPIFVPEIRFSCDIANGQASTFNNTLTQIVVANDTPVGTLLTNIQFEEMPLTLNDAGDWTYSSEGILEDLDKDEGTTEEPHVEAGISDLDLGIPEVNDTLVQLYVAGRTESPSMLEAEFLGSTKQQRINLGQGSLPLIGTRGTGSGLVIRVSPVETPAIGIQGEMGFGVGVCTEDSWLTELGLEPLPGYSDVESENYGNYLHTETGSVVVFIPKFYYRIGSTESERYASYGTNAFDIVNSSEFSSTAEANANGYALHRAFIDDGKEKPGFFMDKYVLSRDGDNVASVKNGQMISLVTTSGYVTSEGLPGCVGQARDAVTLGRLRGYGWNSQTVFQSNAIAMISMAHGQAASSAEVCAWFDPLGVTNFPKGCNNNALGDRNDPSILYTSSGEVNANKPLTGSANHFAKTTHNGQSSGIADINGVIYQMALGISSYGTSATSTTQINDGNAYVFKPEVKLADVTEGWDGLTDAWQSQANMGRLYDPIVLPWGSAISWEYFGNGNSQVFDSSVDGDNWLLTSAGIPLNTGTSASGTELFGNDGNYRYNRQNMFVITSGDWSDTRSGVWCCRWSSSRTHASFGNGVRCVAYGS